MCFFFDLRDMIFDFPTGVAMAHGGLRKSVRVFFYFGCGGRLNFVDGRMSG